MKDDDTKEGYTCECGEYQEFSMWYFAHYEVEITHTCAKCGRKNLLLSGEVIDSGLPNPLQD